jgi:HAD superfamily hydrolase (TIGR01549 family)
VDLAALKVVAFDCDGVLFDSSRANRAYYNSILAQFGLPEMSGGQFAYAIMHTVDETLAHLIQDPQILEAANQYRSRLNYIPFIRHMVEEPFLRDLLAKLRPAYKTAIATNRTDTMDRVLTEHRLEGLFDFVVTAQDVDHPKPHPESLEAVLAHFNVLPNEAIYIGDSELDAMAAQHAGIPFIAFANSNLEADIHVENLEQVARILNL